MPQSHRVLRRFEEAPVPEPSAVASVGSAEAAAEAQPMRSPKAEWLMERLLLGAKRGWDKLFHNISTFHTLDFCLDIVYLDFDGLWINCDIFWYFHENLWWYDILMFFFRKIETKSGLEFGFPLHFGGNISICDPWGHGWPVIQGFNWLGCWNSNSPLRGRWMGATELTRALVNGWTTKRCNNGCRPQAFALLNERQTTKRLQCWWCRWWKKSQTLRKSWDKLPTSTVFRSVTLGTMGGCMFQPAKQLLKLIHHCPTFFFWSSLLQCPSLWGGM